MRRVISKAPVPDAVQPASASAFRVLFLLTLIASACVCSAVIPRALRGAREKALRTKCAGNLRQLSLSSIQYTDDKRLYPHVEGLRVVDGGYDSDHSPQKFQTLYYYGYHDAPEGWVCPASEDAPLPPGRNLRGGASRLFGMQVGITRSSGRTPLRDRISRPTLRETSELSYGYQRKATMAGARSTTPIIADRAVYHRADEDSETLKPGELGNHGAGSYVAYVDGTVAWKRAGVEDDWKSWERENSATLDMLRSSLSNPARDRVVPVPLSRAAVAASFPAGFLLLLSWIGHMGWRRRVPDRLFLRRRLKRRRRWITAEVVGRTRRPEDPRASRSGTVTGRPRVTLSRRQRCPYCHAALVQRDDLVECRSCQTLVHRECSGIGRSGGRCCTLGCLNA